jgi:hypothetical protein
MEFHWKRLPLLVIPLFVAFALSVFLSELFQISGYLSLPASLFVIVQLQKLGFV